MHTFTVVYIPMHCRRQHIPNSGLGGMLFILIIDSHGNAALLGSQHVHCQSQTPLEADDVTPRNGPAEKESQKACHTKIRTNL